MFLFLGKLLLVALVSQILFSISIGLLSKLINFNRSEIGLILLSILYLLFNMFIAYVFSECLTVYNIQNKSNFVITLLVFMLLAFMLNAPSKYGNSEEEMGMLSLTGLIGTLFFILIRYYPVVGDFLYEWIPIDFIL